MSFNPMAVEFVPGHLWRCHPVHGAAGDAGVHTTSAAKPEGPEESKASIMLEMGAGNEQVSFMGDSGQCPDAQDLLQADAAVQKGWLARRPSTNTSGVGSSLAWRAATGLPEVLATDLPAKIQIHGGAAAPAQSVPAMPPPGLEPPAWCGQMAAPMASRMGVSFNPSGSSAEQPDEWEQQTLERHKEEHFLGGLFSDVAEVPEDCADSTAILGACDTTCRWHESAKTVGVVSGDGHVFTKVGTKRKVCMRSQGTPVELAAICMVFDETLRCGGMHNYNYRILNGELGSADGAGFVFDSKVRRKNIQQMRSVFLNQRGCICVRDHEHVRKVGAQLPPLMAGMSLNLHINLDSFYLQFQVYGIDGILSGCADISLVGCFSGNCVGESFQSGFFCAVVTKEISVSLA
mmetsp:Transcript_10809/g.24412  ORF Transcript_10809/g.24412 Transcript_10809/m.24412 type:complete len:404 (+) Transcript_10809:69-1280(+)